MQVDSAVRHLYESEGRECLAFCSGQSEGFYSVLKFYGIFPSEQILIFSLLEFSSTIAQLQVSTSFFAVKFSLVVKTKVNSRLNSTK
jgi:hypothetical protein